MSPFTIAILLVILIGGIALYWHIREYEKTNSFWADVADGMKEHSETITRVHKVTTKGNSPKSILCFKGARSDRLYILDISDKKQTNYTVGTQLRITYILEPIKKNNKERAVVLSETAL